MLGKLLSKTIKIVTFPVDVAEVGMDMMCGGDGSRKNDPFGLSKVRDKVCDKIEDIDD